MKAQLLTSLDIYFMAAELAKSLAGKVIKDIVYSRGYYSIYFEDIWLKFTVIQGSPYIMRQKNRVKGQSRLKLIHGGMIKSVAQLNMDRVMVFDITTFDRLGKKKIYHLYFELYKNGNIVLTEGENKILFSIRKNYSSGEYYNLERSDGFNLLKLKKGDKLNDSEIEQIRMLKLFQHTPITESSGDMIAEFAIDLKENPKPYLLYDKDSQIAGFACYGPPYLNDITSEPQESFLDTLTDYLEDFCREDRPKAVDYKKQIKKVEKKVAAIEAELAETENYKKYRQYGELILANLRSLKKGQTEFVAIDHHDPLAENTIIIPLERSFPPEKNAASYFDKARKLEAAIPIIMDRLAKNKAELEKLIKLDSGEIEPTAHDSMPSKTIKQAKSKIPFRRFDLGNGWLAFAGKSAKSNDELTFGFANKDDIWFHAWQSHGSHIILRSPQRGLTPDKTILLKAASLAAYYSKAKSSSKVPIIYTEVRYLRKVKKVPGKVIYTNESELMVEPLSPQEILS